MTTAPIGAQDLQPGSPGWRRLITSSKVAAILGVSKWDSPRSMWHKMRNDLPEEPQTDVQSRGHYLEPAILAWWADQHPEFLSVLDTQPRYTLGDWAAATPDAVAVNPDDQSRVIVEAKSARDLDEWGTPGTDEIPSDYLIQCYWEMHVSGIHTCYVPIIGAFLDFEEYVVRYDPQIGQQLEARCLEFLESLQNDEPPELDEHAATYDALRKLYRTLDDSTIEIPADVAVEYLDAIATRKAAEGRERAAKSRVLALMGEHRYAEVDGIRVARRQANKTGFQVNQVAKSSTELPATEGPL